VDLNKAWTRTRHGCNNYDNGEEGDDDDIKRPRHNHAMENCLKDQIFLLQAAPYKHRRKRSHPCHDGAVQKVVSRNTSEIIEN